ncbi:MAG TPA: MBL fold metallo-hydrolase, partial [Roseiflexaceae bacterium]|nr:MBL fold metallo-hydrolase [Roseiflexaceae bacterium]
LLPGLYRIETALGDNLLALHLIRGERTLLIDSGVRDTPDTVIFPALEQFGLPPHIDMLLVSHADADHHGGNAALRAGAPGLSIMAHELDRPRIESKAAHLAGRYTDVVVADDLRYDPDLLGWLDAVIGADTPVDIGLRGGETIRLGEGARWQVLHAPGHSAGHLALWEASTRVLIAQDAVLWRGVPDKAGHLPSPPPYHDVESYLATLWRLRALSPTLLLTAHYPIIRGADVDAFFAESLAFVERVDAAVLDALRAAGRPLTLGAVVAALDARLGPFQVAIQWVGPALTHLARHCAAGRLALRSGAGVRMWMAV